MKLASSLASHRAALATSSEVQSRPSGTVASKASRGLAPRKEDSSGVSPATGQSALTRMLSGPSSAAIDLVMVMAAPFEALYQVRPGRGRRPAVDAVLMMQPPPCSRISGTISSAAR